MYYSRRFINTAAAATRLSDTVAAPSPSDTEKETKIWQPMQKSSLVRPYTHFYMVLRTYGVFLW